MNCNICTEKYNKSKRKCVICIVCNYDACRECYKTYISNDNVEAKCFSCKTVFTKKFLLDNFEKKYLNKEYKNHIKNILFEKEIGLLPSTQPYVEKTINMEKILCKIKTTKQKIKELNEELRLLTNEFWDVKYRNGYNNNEEKKQFIKQCPNNNCKGFLTTSWKCQLCNYYSCKDCKELKGLTTEDIENHVCNADILTSVKLLEKDTKSCPKCSALIFKIDGCDQMYCVECHTAFSWKTLKIETKTIHNPHYYEYQRKINNGVIPRNPDDNPCNNIINMNTMNDYKIYNNPFVLYLCRIILHIRETILPKYDFQNNLTKNLNSRIDYMRNIIDDNTFKKLLEKRYKNDIKNKDISDILNLYITCMTDIIFRLINDPKYKLYDFKYISLHSVEKQLVENPNKISYYIVENNDELENLRIYINNCFENISNIHNCKKYCIYRTYHFT